MRFLPAWPLCAATLLGLAAACSSPTAPAASSDALMQSGFEESLGWNDANPTLYATDKAHGGHIAALVSPQVEFGATYARTLDQLALGGGAHRLELNAWVLRTAAGSTARLVAQVDASATDQTKVYYTSLPLADAVPTFGEWKQVSLPIELPAAAQGANRLKVYLWNEQGTSPTYLDDVVLRRVGK